MALETQTSGEGNGRPSAVGAAADTVLAATVRGRGLPLSLRLGLLAALPSVASVAVLVPLAQRQAGTATLVLAAGALAVVAMVIALQQARGIAGLLRRIVARCDVLTARHGGAARASTRDEILGLAQAVEGMAVAVQRHADACRDQIRDEQQRALDLQRQYALMQMLRNLSSAANSGESLERALQNCLREVGAYLDWPLGRLVMVATGPGGAAPVRSHWYAPAAARFAGFIAVTDDQPLEDGNAGLIGRARQSSLSQWISDLSRLDGWHRRDTALACGLRTGFVIPVSSTAEGAVFVEFFSEHRIDAGPEMLELVEAISVELWGTANRYTAEATLRSSGMRARRLASIAEAMEGAIAVTGANGRVEWVNAGMTRLVGCTATQAIGRDVPALLFPSDPASAAECLRLLTAGERVRGMVIPSRREGGDDRWYEMELQPMPDRGAGAAGSFVLVREITHERITQQALGRALEDAKQASQSKSQFLANMSHEIRTPMNGVLGMAELLLGTDLNERQRRFIESLYRSGEALLDIINDILDFSKIEAGKLELETIDFDLRTLVEDLIELLAPRAHQKRIELAYKLTPGLPATVRGDPTRLRQILINIVGNAIKFTERGEVVLTVEPLAADGVATDDAGPATTVRFVVRDTGIGMRPDAVERLFSVFMQADQSSSRRYGGTGLGLAICRQLTDLMKGRITASSRIGEGSVFEVELPLCHGDSSAVPARLVPAASIAGKRVLIAEDNPTNRRILSEQLNALDMDCAMAENGRQALQMLRIAAQSASPFDVAVVDMKMPIMDGMALAEKVRSDPALARVRLVMLTSITGRDEARRAQAIGLDAYLSKPVRQQELVATLAAVLGSEPADPAPQPLAGPLAGLKGRRVLVVEDNPVNQEVVSAMLAGFGCDSRLAEDGLVALNLLEREDFDVVLMDCQMPTLDGFEAMRRLRDPAYRQHDLARARRTPVIALTANALSGDAERCRAAGFSDYLAKPFRQRDLGEVLTRWLAAAGAGAVGTVPAAGAPLPTPAALPVHAGAAEAPVAAAAGEPVLEVRVLDEILTMERNGARDLLRRLVAAYLSSSAALIDTADRGFAAGDAAMVSQALHTLKSSSANLGAVRFSRACAEIDALARSRALDQAAPRWAALRPTHAVVVAALQALVPAAAPAPVAVPAVADPAFPPLPRAGEGRGEGAGAAAIRSPIAAARS